MLQLSRFGNNVDSGKQNQIVIDIKMNNICKGIAF